MKRKTEDMWSTQDRHRGDRLRLFRAVAEKFPAERVLYPGSFVDVAPSFAFPDVTYLDSDDRAQRFFGDREGVREIIDSQTGSPETSEFRFIHGDYTDALNLEDRSFDLLISLYAGFVSEHCGRYLRPGGHLLANSSHGDAAMASISPGFRLVGAVVSHSAGYSVKTDSLDQYLVPKKTAAVTAASLHKTGRGVAYTRPAFAYLFKLDPAR